MWNPQISDIYCVFVRLLWGERDVDRERFIDLERSAPALVMNMFEAKSPREAFLDDSVPEVLGVGSTGVVVGGMDDNLDLVALAAELIVA